MSAPRKQALTAGLCSMALLAVAAGCASNQYQYGTGSRSASLHSCDQNDCMNCTCDSLNRVEYGAEHPTLDRVESVVQAPRVFVGKLLGRREPTLRQQLASEEATIAESQEFLHANGLEDVNIDVRRYDPAAQWDRIWSNDEIAPFWKATGGSLSLLRYTLLPRRVFRRDHYDPYANTLSLNSARPVRGLYAAAEAKQYRQQRLVGTYAAMQYVPVVPVVHHVSTTNDVLSYARVAGKADLERELYPEAYANIGRATVAEVLSVSPLAAGTSIYAAPMMRVAGRAVGRVSGEAAANYLAPQYGENEYGNAVDSHSAAAAGVPAEWR